MYEIGLISHKWKINQKLSLKNVTTFKNRRIFDYRLDETNMTTTIANTAENNAKVKALKKIGQTKWVGNTVHDNLDKCLTAINLDSSNSGWYKPTASRINGLTGIYMINEDGSIFCEARVIKEDDKKFLIEYLRTDAWNEFENLFIQFIDEK